MSKVVAVMPVKGRRFLVRKTVERLLKRGIHVICVCDYGREYEYFTGLDVELTAMMHTPLGKKWNTGFIRSKNHNPDYILYVGSSDWVSDNWLDVMLPIAENYEIVGTDDFYEMHLEYDIPYDRAEKYNLQNVNDNFVKRSLGHWSGYDGVRKGEPIGIGRIVRRDYLDRVNWMPFENHLVKSLDKSMVEKTQSVKSIKCDKIKSLSISTTLWSNRHNFLVDMSNPGSKIINNSEAFLKKWFPDALSLF